MYSPDRLLEGGSYNRYPTVPTVPLGRTEVCGKKNTLWSRRAAILDAKFNEEHDARISFGHRARVQQPARAGGQPFDQRHATTSIVHLQGLAAFGDMHLTFVRAKGTRF